MKRSQCDDGWEGWVNESSAISLRLTSLDDDSLNRLFKTNERRDLVNYEVLSPGDIA